MKYQLTSIRKGNVVSILQVFMDGSRVEIGRFLLPNDKQWRLDCIFLDDILAAYRKRMKKII